jgi:hypothetical protein
MPDGLHALLNDRADALVAGQPVPPVAVVYRRQRPRPGVTARRWGVIAPIVVAVAVLAVVGGTRLIAAAPKPAAPAVVVPPPPTLGVVVPPVAVREKLGAQGGHSAGPAVPEADALALSQPAADGTVLRTVGVVRPIPTPDGDGNARVDRCTATYSDPGDGVLHGRCLWGSPAVPEQAAWPVTVESRGTGDAAWVSGTAPVGTAAVVLRSPGREQLVVATADPGPQWQHRPFYAAWWPRTGTDIVAVDATGKELGRGRLPSDQPTRAGDDDPELGTIETPLDLRDRMGPFQRATPTSRPADVPPPARMDVLAMLRLDDTTTLFTLGDADGTGRRCVFTYLQDLSGENKPSGGASACGGKPQGAIEPLPIQAMRSYSAGTGEPQEQLLEGSAPHGTATLRLAAAGVTTREVKAFDGGARWDGRAYFIAPWPSAPTTRVTALGADGRVIVTQVVRGMNPKAFDDRYLAEQAACMERAGATVIRHEQEKSSPAYEFRLGRIDPARMRQATEDCEDAADRATS